MKGNSNSETGNPKRIPMLQVSKFEFRGFFGLSPCRADFKNRISGFGVCLGFRHSDFGFFHVL